jgi:hypothetical protein
MGRGLKVNTPHYNRVKEQLLEGKWDVSRNIPHRQILDYNVSENNWDSNEYDYPAFLQSVRNLVNDLQVHSLLPSNGEAEGTYTLNAGANIRTCAKECAESCGVAFFHHNCGATHYSNTKHEEGSCLYHDVDGSYVIIFDQTAESGFV